MLKVSGNDVFENDIFSHSSWSSDILEYAGEARDFFDKLNLIGRTIVKIEAMGIIFDDIETFDDINKHENELLGDQAIYQRYVVIDEPLLLTLDNNDKFEIDFCMESNLRISKNCFPPNIHSRLKQEGCSEIRFNLSEFFSCCLSQKITDIEVIATSEYPNFNFSLPEGRDNYIDIINIVFNNGIKLKFNVDIDYGHITATDKSGRALEVRYEELCRLLP
jgi:hypothetical protein